MSSAQKSADWHRTLLVNALRFAAADPGEQLKATPKMLDPLDTLRDVLLHSWEHALAFESSTGDVVLTGTERKLLEPFVEDVRNTDPPSPNEASIALSRLRHTAAQLLGKLKWEGPLDSRVFPKPSG